MRNSQIAFINDHHDSVQKVSLKASDNGIEAAPGTSWTFPLSCALVKFNMK